MRSLVSMADAAIEKIGPFLNLPGKPPAGTTISSNVDLWELSCLDYDIFRCMRSCANAVMYSPGVGQGRSDVSILLCKSWSRTTR